MAELFWLSNAQRAVMDHFMPRNRPGARGRGSRTISGIDDDSHRPKRQIDPLRSEGQAYAEKLKAAGVTVNALNFDGVAHEFFGMAKVVDEAKQAVDAASADLKAALAKSN
jgi:acetyl esterase/lipase